MSTVSSARKRKARPPAPRGRPSSREAMLDAAQAVVLNSGAASLTLDAVARQAGVSKGGVMYHFPSKHALLAAMGQRLVDNNRSRYEQVLAKQPPGAGRALRAYVKNSTRQLDLDDHLSGALLAVLHGAPELVQTARSYFDQRFATLTRGVPFEPAALVYLATEGLWLLEMLQLSPLSAAQRRAMVARLLALAEPAKAPAAAVETPRRTRVVSRTRSKSRRRLQA